MSVSVRPVVCVRKGFDYELTYILTAYELSQFELEVKEVIKKIQKCCNYKRGKIVPNDFEVMHGSGTYIPLST